jgi:hypothetical protein
MEPIQVIYSRLPPWGGEPRYFFQMKRRWYENKINFKQVVTEKLGLMIPTLPRKCL